MSLLDVFGVSSVLLGSVNLALLLKIIYNDLAHVRDTLIQHLRDHATQ